MNWRRVSNDTNISRICPRVRREKRQKIEDIKKNIRDAILVSVFYFILFSFAEKFIIYYSKVKFKKKKKK